MWLEFGSHSSSAQLDEQLSLPGLSLQRSHEEFSPAVASKYPTINRFTISICESDGERGGFRKFFGLWFAMAMMEETRDYDQGQSGSKSISKHYHEHRYLIL
ncbi:hypothetical protein LINPERPRIM_LOCUS27906 [Linum perenne]